MRAQSHYLLREPGAWLPVVALVLNVAFVGFLMSEARTVQTNLKADFAASGASGGAFAGSTKAPMLIVGPGKKMRLDGGAVDSAAELKTALSPVSQVGTIITIRTEGDASADLLSEALQLCGQAGFTKVVFETKPATP